MTEATVTAQIPATPLAASLPAAPLAPYLGVLTISSPAVDALDAPQAEIAALLTSAAVHDLGWLRRIAIRGEDRFRWLSGMVTNEVESLPSHRGAYNLILNAQGRIQGDAHVWREDGAIELELTAEQSEALTSHLDHFIIMDDIELVPLSEESALGLTGPRSTEILASLGLPSLPEPLTGTTGSAAGIPIRLYRTEGPIVPRYALWTASNHIPALWQALQAAGAIPVGASALESLRIAEGIPAYGPDIQSRDLAQETSQTRALNFTKGCYLGQEIVERIRSRGQVHRHLRQLELFGISGNLPTPGTELRLEGAAADSKPAATLTSVTALQLGDTRRIFAIAMVRAEAEIGRQPLAWPGGTAQIVSSPPAFTPEDERNDERNADPSSAEETQ